MKTRNSTKSKLLSSVIALVLCVSMLIGATFAWFTDTASTGVNKIQAGNLDVQLLMYDGSNYVDISDDNRAIFGAGSIAQNNNAETLWEPGKTQVAYLQIKNNGSLDLKYQVALDVTNVSKNLYEVMQYAITADALPSEVTGWTTGSDVTVGRQIVSGTNTTGANPEGVILGAGESHYFALSVHMKEEAGNPYQGGEVDFDLTVFATQLNSEFDSFGPNYDATAEYPVVINTTGNLNVAAPGIDGVVKTTGIQTIGATNTDGMSVTYPAGVKLNTPSASVGEDNTTTVDQRLKFVDNTPTTGVTVGNGESVAKYELTLPIADTNEVLVKVDIDYGADKQIESLWHNGVQMATSAATPVHEYYEYNAATGILTLHVFHASPIDVVFKAPVAIANGVKYYDLQEALNAGGTVVMQKDIVVSSVATVAAGTEVILDMNGKSITVTKDFSGGRPIKNLGKLTVTGNGTIDSTAAKGYGAIRNDGAGVLTIENGTFAGHVDGDGSAIRNAATCVINGGDFTGTQAVYNEGVLTINNGNFHSTSCSSCGPWGYCINNHGDITFNNGTVTGVQGALAIGGGSGVVNGGTFTTVSCETHANGTTAHYAVYIAGETGGATATINGGTFTSVSKAAIHVGNDNTNGDGGINAKATVFVKGGTFISKEGVNVMATGPVTGSPSVQGGTFSNTGVSRQDVSAEVLNSYLAPGCLLTKNVDGTWTVGKYA